MYGGEYPNDAMAMHAGTSSLETLKWCIPNLLYSAGHELRSLARVLHSGDCLAESVFVPLMNLIDFQ